MACIWSADRSRGIFLVHKLSLSRPSTATEKTSTFVPIQKQGITNSAWRALAAPRRPLDLYMCEHLQALRSTRENTSKVNMMHWRRAAA